MTHSQELAIRQALTAARKAEIVAAIIDSTKRVGGLNALAAALAEQQNMRAAQRARRRHSASLAREMRA